MSQIASCRRRTANHRNVAFSILVFCCPFYDEDGDFDHYDCRSKGQKGLIFYSVTTLMMKLKAKMGKMMMTMMSVGQEGNCRGCCEMMKGPGGDRPPLGQTRSQSPQKLILHHFCHLQNLTFLVEGQVTGKRDGQVDQKSQKTFFLQIEPLSGWCQELRGPKERMKFNPSRVVLTLWGESIMSTVCTFLPNHGTCIEKCG